MYTYTFTYIIYSVVCNTRAAIQALPESSHSILGGVIGM